MPKSAKRGRKSPKTAARKTTKRRTNLTLDPDAVAGGERYGKRHGTNLSQLVNGFLRALLERTSNEHEATFGSELTPAVRRLYGVASGGKADRTSHRRHLMEKYGTRR